MTSALAFLISTLFGFVLAESPLPDNLNQPYLRKPQLSSLQSKVIASKVVSKKAILKAFEFYEKNRRRFEFSNQYLAIADFSKPSTQKRLSIIDLKTGKVDSYKVAHGKGSDSNHDLKMDQFSSKPGSYSTPEGFHKMTSTYRGKHGLSLKMQGLEESNQNSLARAIVLHGADYVSWKHTGRSQGCPAVEKKHAKKIIEQLKGGALFYHFK